MTGDTYDTSVMPFDREPPQQWFTCDACDGSGEIVTGYWGYEPGCGHGHMMDHGSPCDRCGGEGGWIGDVEHDQ